MVWKTYSKKKGNSKSEYSWVCGLKWFNFFLTWKEVISNLFKQLQTFKVYDSFKKVFEQSEM